MARERGETEEGRVKEKMAVARQKKKGKEGSVKALLPQIPEKKSGSCTNLV